MPISAFRVCKAKFSSGITFPFHNGFFFRFLFFFFFFAGISRAKLRNSNLISQKKKKIHTDKPKDSDRQQQLFKLKRST